MRVWLDPVSQTANIPTRTPEDQSVVEASPTLPMEASSRLCVAVAQLMIVREQIFTTKTMFVLMHSADRSELQRCPSYSSTASRPPTALGYRVGTAGPAVTLTASACWRCLIRVWSASWMRWRRSCHSAVPPPRNAPKTASQVGTPPQSTTSQSVRSPGVATEPDLPQSQVAVFPTAGSLT